MTKFVQLCGPEDWEGCEPGWYWGEKAENEDTGDTVGPFDTELEARQDMFETEVSDQAFAWVKENFGEEVANKANYGWGVSDCGGRISFATKVYGHGILTTEAVYNDISTIEHRFD